MIWLGLGSLGAFIAVFFYEPIFVQIIIFLLISTVLIIFIRPIAVKIIYKSHQFIDANILVGKEGLVTVKIDNSNLKGRVNVLGKDCFAKSRYLEPINAGEVVVIYKTEGDTLIVDKK